MDDTIDEEGMVLEVWMIWLLNKRGTRDGGEETSKSSIERACSWPSSINNRSLCRINTAMNRGEVIMKANFDILDGELNTCDDLGRLDSIIGSTIDRLRRLFISS